MNRVEIGNSTLFAHPDDAKAVLNSAPLDKARAIHIAHSFGEIAGDFSLPEDIAMLTGGEHHLDATLSETSFGSDANSARRNYSDVFIDRVKEVLAEHGTGASHAAATATATWLVDLEMTRRTIAKGSVFEHNGYGSHVMDAVQTINHPLHDITRMYDDILHNTTLKEQGIGQRFVDLLSRAQLLVHMQDNSERAEAIAALDITEDEELPAAPTELPERHGIRGFIHDLIGAAA